MSGNIATYTGAGNVWVCQAVWDNTISKYISATCGNNATGTVNNVLGSLGHQLEPSVQNGSSFNHTINGTWYSP